MEENSSTPSIKDFKGSMSGLNIAESLHAVVTSQDEMMNKATSTDQNSSSLNQSRNKSNLKRFDNVMTHNPNERNDVQPNTKSSQTSFSEEDEQHFGVKI